MLLDLLQMNVVWFVLVVLFFSCLAYFFCCVLVASLRGWISDKRMETRGYVRKLVAHSEGECPWVLDDEEHATPDMDGGFRKKGSNREKQNRLDKVRGQALDTPSSEQLDELRKNLHITSGSLCFKHGAVYVVTCEGKRRHWKRLGRWETLRLKAAK